jgi:phosphatidylserine/phosphatidylglycerophosphate/cardiolipin synthase-like enzyme
MRLVPLLLVLGASLALAGCAVTPSTPGEFSLVQYPAAGFHGLYAQTAAARTSIDMEMYELDDSLEIAALISAEHRGVSVRVLLDSAFEVRASNEPAFAALKAGGVAVKFATSSTIFHIKTTTFDDETSDISTANLTPQYYSTTRDATIVDSYPVQVKAIVGTFDNDWNGEDPASDEANAPGLVWSPDAESTMVHEINSAQSSVDFTSEELSDPYVYDALATVAQRGVRCRVVMMDDPEWAKAFGAVTGAGCVVHVLPDTKTGLYMHEKLIVVDAGTPNATAMIGSQNASYSSLSFDRELSIILTGSQAPSVVDSLTRTFESDFDVATGWPAG